jgi:hypothetical protein
LFLRFYGGYTLKDVLNEKIVSFYILLDRANILIAREQERFSVIASVPHMTDDARRTYYRNLENAQRDIMDLGKVNTDYSALEVLKKELGVKKKDVN